MERTPVDWDAIGEILDTAKSVLRLHSWDALAVHIDVGASTVKNIRKAVETGRGNFRDLTWDRIEDLAVEADLASTFYEATGRPPRVQSRTGEVEQPTPAGPGATRDQELLQLILDELRDLNRHVQHDTRRKERE